MSAPSEDASVCGGWLEGEFGAVSEAGVETADGPRLAAPRERPEVSFRGAGEGLSFEGCVCRLTVSCGVCVREEFSAGPPLLDCVRPATSPPRAFEFFACDGRDAARWVSTGRSGAFEDVLADDREGVCRFSLDLAVRFLAAEFSLEC